MICNFNLRLQTQQINLNFNHLINSQQSFQKNQMKTYSLPKNKVNFILIFCLWLMIITFSSKVQKVRLPKHQITGYVNQTKTTEIPFKRCFEVGLQASTNQKYINFKPSSLQLNLVKSSTLQRNDKMNLLDDLRSPNSQKYQHMIVFDDYILLFQPTKKILIVKETSQTFNITNSYEIKELDYYVHFKLYKYKNQAIVILLNRKQALILNDKGYHNYQISQVISVSHLEQLGGSAEQFITAQYEQGFGHYQINRQKKKIILLKRFGSDYFQYSTLYIVDFNVNQYNSGKIYFLDQNLGVFQIQFQVGKKFTESKPNLIIPQRSCEALDTIQNQHFVLVCKMQRSSFIVQAFKDTNDQTYKKIQPSFHRSYFNDIKISGQYFMVFSHKTVNIFWNSKKSNLTQSVNTHSQLNLPGLQAFFLNKNEWLYTIQSGAINKYMIQQSKPELSFKFSTPIQKDLQVYFYGPCSQINGLSKQMEKLTCRAEQTLKIHITQQIIPGQEDFSISASIIVILIVGFLLVIWICLKKYRSLESQSQKILDAYKKKKPAQRFVF